MISPADRDNWIVARWGFVRGVTNYAHRDVPTCGYMEKSDGQLVPWPPNRPEGIQWAASMLRILISMATES